jgi:hypothetical protein
MGSDVRRESDALARRLLAEEARGMLTRLARVKSFALHETMVPAAAVSVAAQAAVERYLAEGRRELRSRIRSFIAWLARPEGRQASARDGHRRLSFLRLRFNAVLSQFDVFSVVMTQRSEHETGVWLSGLDVAARDALTLERDTYEMPPIVCYLDRGVGAAIRRARTRLPGGGETPVAIVRVPRERMVGSGIASSLVHEVGHQAAALLDLVTPLRARLQAEARRRPGEREAWHLWELWISETVADLWSVALVGVGSTLGLMGVLSLPRAFVFRAVTDDPHPIPWVRVQLSCALGRALHPDPQWARVSAVWSSYYPTSGLPPAQLDLLARLEQTMPAFIELLLDHRPASLRGHRLVDVLPIGERSPARLRDLMTDWESRRDGWRTARPTLAFAVMGQARADGRLSPEREGRLVAALLEQWALRTAIDTSEACALGPAPRRVHRNQAAATLAAAGVA